MTLMASYRCFMVFDWVMNVEVRSLWVPVVRRKRATVVPKKGSKKDKDADSAWFSMSGKWWKYLNNVSYRVLCGSLVGQSTKFSELCVANPSKVLCSLLAKTSIRFFVKSHILRQVSDSGKWVTIELAWFVAGWEVITRHSWHRPLQRYQGHYTGMYGQRIWLYSFLTPGIKTFHNYNAFLFAQCPLALLWIAWVSTSISRVIDFEDRVTGVSVQSEHGYIVAKKPSQLQDFCCAKWTEEGYPHNSCSVGVQQMLVVMWVAMWQQQCTLHWLVYAFGAKGLRQKATFQSSHVPKDSEILTLCKLQMTRQTESRKFWLKTLRTCSNSTKNSSRLLWLVNISPQMWRFTHTRAPLFDSPKLSRRYQRSRQSQHGHRVQLQVVLGLTVSGRQGTAVWLETVSFTFRLSSSLEVRSPCIVLCTCMSCIFCSENIWVENHRTRTQPFWKSLPKPNAGWILILPLSHAIDSIDAAWNQLWRPWITAWPMLHCACNETKFMSCFICSWSSFFIVPDSRMSSSPVYLGIHLRIRIKRSSAGLETSQAGRAKQDTGNSIQFVSIHFLQKNSQGVRISNLPGNMKSWQFGSLERKMDENGGKADARASPWDVIILGCHAKMFWNIRSS